MFLVVSLVLRHQMESLELPCSPNTSCSPFPEAKWIIQSVEAMASTSVGKIIDVDVFPVKRKKILKVAPKVLCYKKKIKNVELATIMAFAENTICISA